MTARAPEPLMTAAEVAAALAVRPRWVLDRWEAGDLPGFRLTRGCVRFRASEIEEWLRSKRRDESEDAERAE